MSKFEKSMTEIFDVEAKPDYSPTSDTREMKPVVMDSTPNTGLVALDKDLDSDYEESRQTLKDLVVKGNQAIDHLLAIASETEHPRAFEVVATLIKNTAEANEKLMVMQKTIRELKNIKKNDSGVNVDKAIFVGSTSELSKLLKAKNGD
jgi:hypothetical protein